jgi:hypothetical protein
MSEYLNPSCPMYRKPSWNAYRQSIEPGAFLWTMSEPKGYPPYRVLWIRLPNGKEARLPIGPIEGDTRVIWWAYDSNSSLGLPTITPSIKQGHPGGTYYWHGFVTQGVLVGCREDLP